jgi:hypothetical protein
MLNALRDKFRRQGSKPQPRCIAELEGFGYQGKTADRDIVDFPPSFFVIGAPRCGTTATSKALARNPYISFSKPKEPHYFLEPAPGRTAELARREYIGRYHNGLNDTHQAIGDGSVSYLYSPEAIQRVLEFDPRAKFIILVRDPVEMMRSYHSRMLFQLDEDQLDFTRAWELQEARAEGRNVPKRCRDARLLQYAFLGRLGEHVERVFQTAGRERCRVIVYDDFVRDPRAVYLETLKFIGVDDDGQVKFKRTRETSSFKSAWLQQYVMNPPPWTYRLLRVSNTRVLKNLKQVRKRIKKYNAADSKPQQIMTDETRAMLREYFADDVAKLAGLLSRDLSEWQ